MKITLKLFATLTAFQGPAAELELAAGTTVGALIGQRGLPRRLCTMVLVNGAFVPTAELDSRILEEGDVLAIWPPVGGG